MQSDANQQPLLLSALTPRERDILQLMADDLSNAEIAERLVMTAGTVKWYVKQIYSKLDVHTRDEAIARAADLKLTTQPQLALSTPSNLPAPTTSLVGREQEIAAVYQLLLRDDVRLLTLVGTAGIGKTRLSIEAAAMLLGDFPDGVYFVSLAPLSAPSLVANAIAQTLDVQETGGQNIEEMLKSYLREKRLLLVLDNFEHLLPAAPLVSELLKATPNLKVLATSREALRVYGEQEYPVPPLSQPDVNYGGDLSTLSEVEAVALFVKRAQAVKPDFELTPENASAVAEICIHLEGLPLAIELAAARVKRYNPEELLGRLNQRLNILTGGARDLPERQQTLRGAIAWSYDLLNEDEKRLFARLGVFVGGWSLEAMEAVASCVSPLQIDTYDGLESLLNKSLVRQIERITGEPRFIMLETLREYALEKLAERGEDETIRRAHAEYFLSLAGHLCTLLRTAEEFRAFQAFETDYANIRTAWLCAVQHCDEDLLGLATEDISRFYADWGRLQDGVALYEAALDAIGDSRSLTAADLMDGYGNIITQFANAFDVGETYARRALEIYDQLGRDDRKASPLTGIARARSWFGDPNEAERLLLEALKIAKTTTFRHADRTMLNIAVTAAERKDHDRAREMLETLRDSLTQRGIHSQLSWVLVNLFSLAVEENDLVAAKNLAQELLDNASAIRQYRFIAYASTHLSLIAFIERDYDLAGEYAKQALDPARRSGKEQYVAESEVMLSVLAAMKGDARTARQYFQSALRRMEHMPYYSTPVAFLAAPYVVFAAGEPERALEYVSFIINHPRTKEFAYLMVNPLRTALETQLSAEAYEAAWERGKTVDLEAAIAYTLSEGNEPTT
ncbi:MAG TPA: LuxR C-terminal-related transcriptional regulator [Oceanobacillus sp.]|nr:LuxR C-terminal-related transcriptional regulator [Oceanobacillus sp.]